MDHSFQNRYVVCVGRPRAFDVQAAEHKAMEYFWQHGYSNTSLDDLVKHLGVSRSSLYNVWDGKDALFRASFARYLRTIGMEALTPLQTVGPGSGAHQASPRAAVTAVFDTISIQISHDRYRRGCLMVNTIAELSEAAPELARLAHEAATQVRRMFRAALEPTVTSRERTAVQADEDAAFLLTAFLGLRVMARSGPTEAEARAVANRTIETVFGRETAGQQ